MFTQQQLSANASKLVNTTNIRGIGKVSFCVNGEVILHDATIICYGAMDQDLMGELLSQPSVDKFLRFLKEQGYRIACNIRDNRHLFYYEVAYRNTEGKWDSSRIAAETRDQAEYIATTKGYTHVEVL